MRLKKINEVYHGVDTDDRGILSELSEFFKFKIPNAHFNPKVKAGLWDGYIRLFNTRDRVLYSGLIPYLKAFQKKYNYNFKLPELEWDKSLGLTEDEVLEFSNSLKPSTDGEDIELYEHQLEATTHCLNHKRCVLLSGTSSGKSFIIYNIIRWLQEHEFKNPKDKILIVVPTVDLVNQMYNDFEDYATNDSWKASDNVHKIFAGQSKSFPEQIVVSTWQSIFTQKPEYFEDFVAVFGDEAHMYEAKSVKGIMENLVNASYRIGTSGTLEDTKVHKLVLESLFGPVKEIIKVWQQIEQGIACPLIIRSMVLKYTPESLKGLKPKDKKKGISYQDEDKFICNHQKRLKFIASLALTRKNNTMILFDKVEKHGKPLFDLISKYAEKYNKEVFFIWRKTPNKERTRIKRYAERNNNVIIIASYKIFSTGTNIKNIHHLILAASTKSKIRLLQSIGRGVRLCKGKLLLVVYDIVDDFRKTKRSKQNYGIKHFLERVKIYTKEKYPYKIEKVSI